MNLKFRHKILLSACGVVVLAFALFTLYNDYLQRNTCLLYTSPSPRD